jgi:hypothetical protein
LTVHDPLHPEAGSEKSIVEVEGGPPSYGVAEASHSGVFRSLVSLSTSAPQCKKVRGVPRVLWLDSCVLLHDVGGRRRSVNMHDSVARSVQEIVACLAGCRVIYFDTWPEFLQHAIN